MTTSACPSCGYAADSDPSLPHPPFPASPECWWKYGELAAYNMERARPDFLHQEAVDAYAAQHPGLPAKPIALWFALIGLHLALDLGRTGREVQQAHMLIGRQRHDWPVLTPPPTLIGATAGEVFSLRPGDDRDEGIITWARAVWALWHDQQVLVAEVCEKLRIR